MTKLKRVMVRSIVFLFLVFILGFGAFLYKIYTIKPLEKKALEKNITTAVVFTGGVGRIGTALKLLKDNHVAEVFISGVRKNLGPKEMVLLHKNKKLSNQAECLYIGYDAKSTLENVEETKKWLKKRKIKSLYLVTSYYHMPRSCWLMKAALPSVEMIPVPVWPEKPKKLDRWVGRIKVVFLEYIKYLRTPFQVFKLKDVS